MRIQLYSLKILNHLIIAKWEKQTKVGLGKGNRKGKTKRWVRSESYGNENDTGTSRDSKVKAGLWSFWH